MTDFTTLGTDEIGDDKILRAATMSALYNNGLWAGEKGLATQGRSDVYNSGSGTWSKPSGYDTNDTVLIECWGGGGGGGVAFSGSSLAAASGGEGGSYLAYAIKYSDCPATLTYNVGAGGSGAALSANGNTNGTDGGDTNVTVSTRNLTAFGGAGGSSAAGGGAAASTTSEASVTIFGMEVIGQVPYSPGNGGSADGATAVAGNGGNAPLAAAGGGGAAHNGSATANGTGGYTPTGGIGGNGAASVTATPATAQAGTAPGGGGGAAVGKNASGTATSGAGAAGRVNIRVLRGWHPVPLSRV